MNKNNIILYSILIFVVFISCESKSKNPKSEYNQKANQLIQQLIEDENCDCILEIPKENIIEVDSIENPYFDYGKFFIEKLSLKNKNELDSINKLSNNFALDLSLLKKRNIKIIKRDSLRILLKDSNFYMNTCKDLKFLIKPVFNKEFNFAIVNYGSVGSCTQVGKHFFKFTNGKWNKMEYY